jgi:hypothetical protein
MMDIRGTTGTRKENLKEGRGKHVQDNLDTDMHSKNTTFSLDKKRACPLVEAHLLK